MPRDGDVTTHRTAHRGRPPVGAKAYGTASPPLFLQRETHALLCALIYWLPVTHHRAISPLANGVYRRRLENPDRLGSNHSDVTRRAVALHGELHVNPAVQSPRARVGRKLRLRVANQLQRSGGDEIRTTLAVLSSTAVTIDIPEARVVRPRFLRFRKPTLRDGVFLTTHRPPRLI